MDYFVSESDDGNSADFAKDTVENIGGRVHALYFLHP